MEAIVNGTNGDVARTIKEKVDLSDSRTWLKGNRLKFVGQWVVRDGNKLIGAGNHPRPIVEKARDLSVQVPFVKFIEDDSESFMAE